MTEASKPAWLSLRLVRGADHELDRAHAFAAAASEGARFLDRLIAGQVGSSVPMLIPFAQGREAQRTALAGCHAAGALASPCAGACQPPVVVPRG